MRKNEWEVERLIGLFASPKIRKRRKTKKKMWTQTRARKMQRLPLMMIKYIERYTKRRNKAIASSNKSRKNCANSGFFFFIAKGKYIFCLCTFEIRRKRWRARHKLRYLGFLFDISCFAPGFSPSCNYQCTHPFNRNVFKFF